VKDSLRFLVIECARKRWNNEVVLAFDEVHCIFA